ncbi:MAG: NfeD family protein [Lawsonibacter sp.]|nr:NfeD family protein [Lawsonibacter sp.]
MTAFWLIAFIALVAGEAVTVGLVCIWFAAGAVGGFLVAVLGGQFWFQLIVFAAVSALTLALVRPAASRFVHPRRSPTNADRVVNQTAAVTETIDNEAGTGQINVLGQVWTARSELGVVIPAGTQVKVRRIEGVKVFVETL